MGALGAAGLLEGIVCGPSYIFHLMTRISCWQARRRHSTAAAELLQCAADSSGPAVQRRTGAATRPGRLAWRNPNPELPEAPPRPQNSAKTSITVKSLTA